mgnify:CR=1 FL=1
MHASNRQVWWTCIHGGLDFYHAAVLWYCAPSSCMGALPSRWTNEAGAQSSVAEHAYVYRCKRLTAVLQFSYTTVFGWYADFLFLRTGTRFYAPFDAGSLLAPLAADVLCSCLGLPRMPHRPSRHQRWLAYALHGAGLVAFVGALFPLSHVSLQNIYW